MAELEAWTCEYGGLVLGAPDSALSLVQVDGLLSLPDIRSSDLTLVQQNGLWAGDDYLNGRAITLTVEVYGNGWDGFKKALSALQAAFRPGRPELPFRFRFPGLAGDATAYVMARPRKRSAPLDLNFAYGVCNVVVELFATKPEIYADSLKTARVTPGTTTYMSQLGSEPARPVIAITDAKDPVLTDTTTGQFFGVNYTGNLTIDSAAMTVKTSAGGDITGLITEGSVWPEYEAGEHRLKLETGNSLTTTSAVLTWRECWI